MEKFKQWIDPGTGINPFVHFPTRPFSSSGILNFFFFLVKLLIFIIKVPILTIFAIMATGQVIIFHTILFLWFVRRPVQRWASFVTYRAALFVLGFFKIQVKHVDASNNLRTYVHLLRHIIFAQYCVWREKFFLLTQGCFTQNFFFWTFTTISTSLFADKIFAFNSGDLIFCNHSSYVEILYLMFRHAPVFANIVNDKKSGEIKVIRQTSLGYLLSTITQTKPSTTDGAQVEDLSQVVKYAKEYHWGPVVVFPEAVTSNGRGILKFQKVFDGALNDIVRQYKIRTHIITFNFEYEKFSPCFHIQGTALSHFFHLATQGYNTMQVRVLTMNTNTTTNSDSGEAGVSPAVIRKLFEEMLVAMKKENLVKQRCVSFGWADKDQFLQRYNETRGNYYEKQ